MMNSNSTHSMNKQGILKRMLSFAANQMGIKQVELLDPILILFIESLAEEIYTASFEIGNIESRILDTLSEAISPNISLLPHPAHCVMYAVPQEGTMSLSSKSPFIFNNKKKSLSEQEKLSFYPLFDTSIRRGGIRYVVYNGLFYQIEGDHNRTLISRSRNQNGSKSVWIGLDLDETIADIQNLSFYIDIEGVPDKNKLLTLLPFSTWSLNGNKLNIKPGVYLLKKDGVNETVDLFEHLTTVQNLYTSIENLYSKHFLTVDQSVDIASAKKNYPEQLQEYFPAHIFEDLKTPLLWIEVEFPPNFNASILENMLVSINAFPVVNKSLHYKTVELREPLGIIPLETDNHESLLSIDSITDSSGRIYHELPFGDTEENIFGTYSIRRGGYERYSKREMREYLKVLIKRMESLSAVNNGDKNEDNSKALTLVHVLIKDIEEYLSNLKEKLDIQYYILIDELKNNEVYYVEYSTVNPRFANNIKQYSYFEYRDKNSLKDVSTSFSLSTTSGGKSIPDIVERQNLQIKSLTDQSVLITDDDIIKYCEENFGTIISHITITKGIVENPQKKHEFIRTKDVTLTCRKEMGHQLTVDEAEQFRLSLQQHSPATFNYRVVVK